MNTLASSFDAGSPVQPPAPASAHRQVIAAYDKIAAANRPELWTVLWPREEVLVEAKAVDERVRAGARLPLAGLLVAVNDNVEIPDCSADAGKPAAGAVAVRRLVQAGAVALGKTCSSGEITGRGCALAVALDLVDVVLATDPVGSGGVAAACHGIVEIRPTRGLVPMTGISGAGVTVFARGVVDGQRALAAMTGPDESDPGSRRWPGLVRLAAGERPRVAVADPAGLSPSSEEARRAYTLAIGDLSAAGVVVETIDVRSFVEAVSLAHGGNPRQRARASKALDGYCALVLPAVWPRETPQTGRRHGIHPDFVGLLDLAAVTIPGGRAADGAPFGVSVLTRSFDDQVALDLAALLTNEQLNEPYPAPNTDLVVFGAHLRGQPLNHQLADLGARFRSQVLTAECYRMVALPTVPPTPGVFRGSPGAALEGERWTISPAGLDRFLAGLEGSTPDDIELEDGSTALGFPCDAGRAAAAKDITRFGDWRAYLRHLTATRPMVPVD